MADFIPTPTMGEILKEEFMVPMNLSAYKLAQEIHVPVSRIQAILNSGRRITADRKMHIATKITVRIILITFTPPS